MLSYWPSLGLLAVFLVIVIECRAIGARVTLPLGSFLVLFCYGCIGAPLLAVLVQQLPVLAGFDPASMAWLTGPPLEELAKAVPVIILAFLTRESRRLSIADLTLAGFASGAGFGFVEANLKMIVDGALPDLQYFLAFGLQVAPSSAPDGSVFFAGHAVTTGLVGLAAGIGLHILQLNRALVWLPSAVIVAWASFDHGVYNWKVLHADAGGVFPQAHFAVELLHRGTMHGLLATWALAVGLIAAQIIESYLCAKAVGRRRDLLLALEWRPWVINEWLVALMRVPFGRGALARTLAYFRLRRAFFLARLQAKRDATDVTLIRHARSLEDRLKRERALVFDPPSGTWFLPLPVLGQSAAQWAWHMRWVLLFAGLLFMLFMLDPATLPGWLRQLLFGDIFTKIVLIGGLAFAVWKIILFSRSAPPDPLAAEGAAFANYYTRELLLGCSLLCGLFPTLALMLGWNAVAPGAAFLSGYLPGWIGQGGNLQTLLGLGAFGGAVTPDPRPAGDALRHEIAAGDERIRRLESDLEGQVDAGRSESSGALTLDGFLEAMERLDAERDVQARRQIAFAEFQRQAADSLAKDPAPVVEAVKDEFDRLASELLETAAKELDAIASFEQAYGKAWANIMQHFDSHDEIRRRLKGSLRQLWHADPTWALRVVERTDECLLPMQLALLPELQALVSAAPTGRADTIAAGLERILRAAAESALADPSDFQTGAEEAAENEGMVLRELDAPEQPAEAPARFGARTTTPDEAPAPQEPTPDVEAHRASPAAQAEAPKAETAPPADMRGEGYQQAVDRFMEAMRRDTGYIETIRRLEQSHESFRPPAELLKHPEEWTPPAEEPPGAKTDTSNDDVRPRAEVEDVVPASEPKAEGDKVEALDDIIDAIKRDSGYLDLVKKPTGAQAEQAVALTPPTSETPEVSTDSLAEPAAVSAEPEVPSAADVSLVEEPIAEPAIEPIAAATSASEQEQVVLDAAPRAEESAAEAVEALQPSAGPAATLAYEQPVAEEDSARPDAASDTAQTITPEPAAQPPSLERTAPAAPSSEPTPPTPRKSGALFRLPEEPAPQSEKPAAHVKKWFGGVTLESTHRRMPSKREDTPAQHLEPSKADEAPAAEKPQVAPPSAELRESVAPAEKREPELQQGAGEPAAPKTPDTWQADFAAAISEDGKVKSGDASLQPIDWPTLGESGSPERKAETSPAESAPVASDTTTSPATSASEAQPAQQETSGAKAVETGSAPEAAAPTTVTAQPSEAATDAPARQAARSVTRPTITIVKRARPTKTANEKVPDAKAPESAPVAPESGEPAIARGDPAPPAETPQPQTPDAPTAEATPAPVEQAPIPASPAVDLAKPAAVEDTQLPTSREDQPLAPVPTPVGTEEVPTKTDRLTDLLGRLERAMQAKAAAEKPPGPASVGTPVRTGDPAKPTRPPVEPPSSPTDAAAESKDSDQLKPDRLSFLLTKLFEAVKRESGEQTAKPDPVEHREAQQPLVAGSAPDETLDLRIAEPSASAGSADVQGAEIDLDRSKLPAEEGPAGSEAVAGPVSRPTETTSAPQPAVQPPESSRQTETQIEPSTPSSPAKPISRTAAATGTFGTRRKPPPTLQNLLSETTAPRPPEQPAAATAQPSAKHGKPESVAPASGSKQPTAKDSPAASKEQPVAKDGQSAPKERPSEATRSHGETKERQPVRQGALRPDRVKDQPQERPAAATASAPATFRAKSASGALTPVEALPGGATAGKMPAKYYGPKHVGGAEEGSAAKAAHQRASNLAEALAEYYAKTDEPQPPMHTTDRNTLQRVIHTGKLEAPRRRGAPWSLSGMARRGEVVIRLKPGAEKYVEFVPSKESFGQVPHFYQRGVGKGSFVTYVPAAHLEVFDPNVRAWIPLEKGRQ